MLFSAINVIVGQKIYRSDSIQAYYYFEDKYMGFEPNGEPINGTYLDVINGRVWKSTEYKNGLNDGFEKTFFGIDTIESITEWSNGLKNGKDCRYFPPSIVNGEIGKIRIEHNYKDGLRFGFQRTFSKDGKILGEVNLVDGNGIYEVYTENGNLNNISFFKNGNTVYSYQKNLKGFVEEFNGVMKREVYKKHIYERVKEKNDFSLGNKYDRHFKNHRLIEMNFYSLRMKTSYYRNGNLKSVDIYKLDKKCFDKKGNLIDCKKED